ncbi:ROK family protein [Arachidicoccus terrestris]|uniref:ROK family protein n=1 Tax=Arachidicoccus terrestris TaxID=2875539 RepID=UPI001CC3924F|nr:ROK family transcriptional regulator [Arachidicoccus terrestris]UAY57199.1 ROK family protein [Arachidicoccus terrestris]
MATKTILNKKNIIKALFLSDGLSFSEISEQIGKSHSLTMKLVAELVEDGILIEKGLAPSSGGRRPQTHSLRPDTFYLVAVAMDQFVSRIVILDANRGAIAPVHQIELHLADNLQSLDVLTKAIQQYIAEAPIDRSKILGIGIGMPGFINAEKGANFTFLGTNVGTHIKEQTGYPTFIENDSSTIAIAEIKYGQATEEKNAMILNLSWGIGLGMILEGKLFRGNDGFAGEFSHIPLFKNGKLCSCGKTGCLETETSLSYMIKKAKSEIRSGRATYLTKIPLDDIDHEAIARQFIEAAILGDTLVIEIISSVAYNIGRGIAILMHLINPGKVILSGRMAGAGRVWLAPIQQAINEFCIPKLVSNTKIELSKLGHEAEIIGAATLVIENIKQCPMEHILTAKQISDNL